MITFYLIAGYIVTVVISWFAMRKILKETTDFDADLFFIVFIFVPFLNLITLLLIVGGWVFEKTKNITFKKINYNKFFKL